MGLLKKLDELLFGVKSAQEQLIEVPPAEAPIDRTVEAYYQRMLRLKPEILKKSEILENMRNAFEHVYLNKPLSPEVINLGEGDTHIVLNVGEVIDPLNSRPVYIAVRLFHYFNLPPYDMGARKNMMIPQLYDFQEAFVQSENPPYFVGVVSWEGPKDKYEHRVIGFVLEDVSEKKRYKLISRDHEHFSRIEGEGRYTRFFLDPMSEYLGMDVDSEYLSDEARIDL